MQTIFLLRAFTQLLAPAKGVLVSPMLVDEDDTFSSNGWRQPKALIQRLQEYQTPYSFSQAEPTLQKPVFEPIHKQLYPNGISTTEGFSKRNGADSIPEATDRIANEI
ncbi:hypothetical protein K457DRAFT_1881594 [Linnemannia elongata AG-77]|uniref:Uncharacterized protein n=1 Tax=Linnemannia elongata AG-77 TaxID=1314771 RepID=A0A197JDT0_9FUNG|nr:hypothetical protein K457DRAFT_1881594 [Linnemannia elongata AG-77]